MRVCDNTKTLTPHELLVRLVAFDSTSDRPNRPIADYVSDVLAADGCCVWRQEADGGAKVNVLAWREPRAPGVTALQPGLCDGLLLAGHLDTVPATKSDWNSDPFVAVERGGKLFGRGTADMKGFVALAVHALATADEDELRAPVALLLTFDEELGGLGAQHFVQHWRNATPLPRNCIIGEPTDLSVVRMHKGHLKLRFTVRGKAAHSGLPHLGVNAIERGAAIVGALGALAEILTADRTEASRYFPDCPHPALNIGLIRGGSAVNIVPDECVIDIGVRLLPGQQTQPMLDRIERWLNYLPIDIRGAAEMTIINDNPPLFCDEGARVNIELTRLLGQTATCGVSFASDGGVLARLGLDCVLFGPGNMEHAHRANEFIEIEQFEVAGRWLDRIITRFCRETHDAD